MADAQETIEIRLIAQDDASATIAAVGAALERLGTGLDLGGIQNQLTGLGNALSGVGNTGLGALPDQVRALGTSLEEAAAPARTLATSLGDVARGADQVGTRMSAATDQVRTALAGQTDAVRQALALQTQLVQQAAAAQAAFAPAGARPGAIGGLTPVIGVIAATGGAGSVLESSTIPAALAPADAAALQAFAAYRQQRAALGWAPSAATFTVDEDPFRYPSGALAKNPADTAYVAEQQAAQAAIGPAQERYTTILGQASDSMDHVTEQATRLAGSLSKSAGAADALALGLEHQKTLMAPTEGEAARGIVSGLKPEDVVPPEATEYSSGLGGLFSWWPGRRGTTMPASPGALPPSVQAAIARNTPGSPPPAGASGGGGFFDMPWGFGGGKESEAPGSSFLKETAQIGSSFLIWGTLFGLWYQGQQALMGLASGLVTTNVEYQHLSATLSALYGSDGAGQQALNWADSLAEKLPQTREEVRAATLTLASAGVDIGTGLPAIAELTSAVHPTGGIGATAQAVVDAMAGRTEMLRVSLRTQIEPLRQFGLEVEKSGHIVQSTFVPALERYIQMRFGEHVDVDAKALAGLNQQQLEVAHATMIAAGGRVAAGTLSESDARTQAVPQVLAAFADPRTTANMALLHAYFGVTAGDLKQINSAWDASAQSAQAAFQKWLEASYGGQAALAGMHAQLSATQKDFLTLGGAASNILDVFQDLQRRAGMGLTASLQRELTGNTPGQVNGIVGAIGERQGIGGALEGAASQIGGALGTALDHLMGQLNQWYQQMGGFPGVLLMVTNAWKQFVQAVQTAWGILEGIGAGLHVVFEAVQLLWSAWQPLASGLLGLLGNQVLVGGLTAIVVGMRLLSFTVGAASATWTNFARAVGLSTEALAANAAAQTAATTSVAVGAAGAAGPLARMGGTALGGLAGGAAGFLVGGGVGSLVGGPSGGAIGSIGGAALGFGLGGGLTSLAGGALSSAPLTALAEATAGVPILGRAMAGLTSQMGLATLGVGAFLADFYLVPEAFNELTQYIQNLHGVDVRGQAPAVRAALQLGTQGALISPAHILIPATPAPTATPPPGLTPFPTVTPSPGSSMSPGPSTIVPAVYDRSPQEKFEAFLQGQPGAFKQYTGAGWAFNRMVDTDNPQYWAQWLAQHPDDPITKQYLSLLPATAPAGQASQQTVHQVMTAALPGLASTAYTQYNAAMAQVQRDALSKLNQQNLPGDIALAAQAEGLVQQAQGRNAQQQAAAIDATYNRLARQYGIPTLATTPPESQKPPSYGPDTYAQNLQQVQQHLQADLLRGASPAALQADYGHIRDVAQRGERMNYADADAVFMALHQAQEAIAQHIKQQGQKAAQAAGETLSWQELVHAPLAAVTDTIAKVAAGLKQENESATQIALQKVQMIEAAGQAQLQYDSQTKASRAQVAADTAWIANNLHAAGLSMAEASRVANKMRDDLVRQSQGEEAKAAYTLALGQGHITSLSQVPGFVSAIMATEPSTAGPNQRALDQFQLMRQGQDAVLQNARDHLTFDIGAHASMTQLRSDERDYLKILAVELGGTGSWAYKLAKQQVDAQIAGNNAAVAAIGAPPPHYARFGGLATAYGSATVSFGGLRDPESATVRELRQTNEHLRAALQRDQSLINLLESELVVDKAQLGALQSINGHVAPPPPRPAQDVHAHVKARGGFAPVGR